MTLEECIRIVTEEDFKTIPSSPGYNDTPRKKRKPSVSEGTTGKGTNILINGTQISKDFNPSTDAQQEPSGDSKVVKYTTNNIHTNPIPTE